MLSTGIRAFWARQAFKTNTFSSLSSFVGSLEHPYHCWEVSHPNCLPCFWLSPPAGCVLTAISSAPGCLQYTSGCISWGCLRSLEAGFDQDRSSLMLALSFFAHSVQFSSVAQSCLTLCDPMDCSTPGLPVHHQLPEFAQTHVHWVGDAIQPSHPLSFPSPSTFNLSQHQGLFKWVSSAEGKSSCFLCSLKLSAAPSSSSAFCAAGQKQYFSL